MQLFQPLAPMRVAPDAEWDWNDSTAQLSCTWRPGGILEEAATADAYTMHLAKFADPGVPLDMVYVSLHTYWLHNSGIPQRAMRLVRTVEDNAPGQQQQLYYLDDVEMGTWTWEAPSWLSLARNHARFPGSVRWFEAAPGTYGFVHRSDVASEPWWQLTLVPIIMPHEYAGRMLPLADA